MQLLYHSILVVVEAGLQVEFHVKKKKIHHTKVWTPLCLNEATSQVNLARLFLGNYFQRTVQILHVCRTEIYLFDHQLQKNLLRSAEKGNIHSYNTSALQKAAPTVCSWKSLVQQNYTHTRHTHTHYMYILKKNYI